jgi:2-hydroxychromene-2-carboxylate isomerase
VGAPLEFWFEFASSYSYPASMRVEDTARAAGVSLVWKPFLLGPIFGAQGWNDSPFNIYLAKGRYMWRDLERICAKLGVPLRRPSRFPRNGLLAARVALVAADAPWGAEFVRAAYRANFADDRDIADVAVVRELLAQVGADAAAVLAAAQAPDNKDRLRRQTEEAVAHGIFGAPTFVSRGELFWGNDRLEDALGWHLAHANG